jgi:hypothetical protein
MNPQSAIIGTLVVALAVNSVVLNKKNQQLKNAHKAFDKAALLVDHFADKLDLYHVPITPADREFLDAL